MLVFFLFRSLLNFADQERNNFQALNNKFLHSGGNIQLKSNNDIRHTHRRTHFGCKPWKGARERKQPLQYIKPNNHNKMHTECSETSKWGKKWRARYIYWASELRADLMFSIHFSQIVLSRTFTLWCNHHLHFNEFIKVYLSYSARTNCCECVLCKF